MVRYSWSDKDVWEPTTQRRAEWHKPWFSSVAQKQEKSVQPIHRLCYAVASRNRVGRLRELCISVERGVEVTVDFRRVLTIYFWFRGLTDWFFCSWGKISRRWKIQKLIWSCNCLTTDSRNRRSDTSVQRRSRRPNLDIRDAQLDKVIQIQTELRGTEKLNLMPNILRQP
jgi:hypothetical protein